MSRYEYEKILIQCANRIEFQALLKSFEDLGFECRLQTESSRQFFVTGDERVMVLCGSYGKMWAAASCEFGIITHKPELVIDFGTCGAILRDLKVGDWILPDTLLEYDVFHSVLPSSATVSGETTENISPTHYPEMELDADLNQNLKSQLELYLDKMGVFLQLGRLLCADRDIQSLEERKELFKKFGGVAVCWETMAIARVSSLHELDFLSFRVVSDVGALGLAGKAFLQEFKKNAKAVLAPASSAFVESLKKLGWI